MKVLGQEWRPIYVKLGHFHDVHWRFPMPAFQFSPDCSPIAALFSKFFLGPHVLINRFLERCCLEAYWPLKKRGVSGDGDELIRSVRRNPAAPVELGHIQ